MTPRQFVRELSSVRLENVFNPYTDHCPLHDRHDAPRIRRRNLRRALSAATVQGVDTLWVARDLGYRGGRRTGLALTDDAHLENAARLLGCASFDRATLGPPVAERTAAVVYEMLARAGRPVFLWNVFPCHPHAPDDALSNRRHTAAERELARPILDALVDMLSPRLLVAIGRDAEHALTVMDARIVSVRHPSYGGANVFREGMRRVMVTT